MLREAAAGYADGVSAPAGADRPSARLISNTVNAMLEDAAPSDRNLSAFVYVWGQFLDHDLDLTVSSSPAEPLNILVPIDDALFDPNATGTQVIPLNRSQYDPATGTSTDNRRQQTNSSTASIDGSVVYGSDAVRAAALRTFVGGKLKTSAGDLLPFNVDGLANANSVASIEEMDQKLAQARKDVWAGRDLPFLVALDGGGPTRVRGTGITCPGATTAAYGIAQFPTTLVIGRDGKVVQKVKLYDPEQHGQIEETLRKLVSEQR